MSCFVTCSEKDGRGYPKGEKLENLPSPALLSFEFISR